MKRRQEIRSREEVGGMSSDRLFAEKREQIDDFTFDRETARVFDDMLSRSVPFYAEIQRTIAEIASDFAVDNTNIYDLGCSLCTTFLRLQPLDKQVTFIGLDASADMLAQAKQNLGEHHFS